MKPRQQDKHQTQEGQTQEGRTQKGKTLAIKAGLTSSQSFDGMLRIAVDRLLDFLCDAPLTREFPGIRYLAAHDFKKSQQHFIVNIPLENLQTSEVQVIQAGQMLTVVAPRHHENGALKLHWSEGTNGYGTWRRRYRVPTSGNLNTLRVVPGKTGADIVLDETDSIASIAA